MGGFTGKPVFKKVFEANQAISAQQAAPKEAPKDIAEEERLKSLERKKKGRRSLLYAKNEKGVKADTLGGN